MNYSDFKNLDDFKVYLKKITVEDVEKALDEIEEVAKVNSSVFDACLIFKAKHKRFTEYAKQKKYDEQTEIQFGRLLNSMFGLINDLRYRNLKERPSKHFIKKTPINQKEKTFKFLIQKVERLLYQDIDAFFDYLKDKLEFTKTDEFLLLRMQRNTLEKDNRLGLMTKKDKEDAWDELFRRLLSFVDNLNESDFHKDIFKN